MTLAREDRTEISKFVRDTVQRIPPRAVKAMGIGRLIGTPEADTPPLTDSSDRLATTNFVQRLISGISGVTSVFGRTGVVVAQTGDYSISQITGAVTTVFGRSGAVVATSGDYTAAQVTNAADKSSASTQSFTGALTSAGIVTGTAMSATGITGATTGNARAVGGNASGAPTSGTFAVGDYVINNDGSVWVCTVAGSPGTWVETGSLGNKVTSVYGRTGAVVAVAGDYTAAEVTNAADKSSASVQSFAGGVVSTSASNGVGYATGSGGTGTVVSSAVTINKLTGKITGTAVAASGSLFVTVTNSTVAASDIIIINLTNGATSGSFPPEEVFVLKVAAGSFVFGMNNNTGTSITPTFNFAVIKGATA